MIFIDRTQTDPYFNIAAEEYVLKNIEDDVFMIWINKPAVIVGKHQVAAAEANILHTHANAIPIIRRISGGGTVYHDEGNLNYTLISSGIKGQLVDYEKYAGTVIRTLKKFNLDASLQRKSSLYVKGMKFSGNAEHVFRNKVLHHGTLLFDSNLDELRRCIRPSHQDYTDKSIKSVDSSISNLRDHLPRHIDIIGFKEQIIMQATEDFPNIKEYGFSQGDIDQIKVLVSEKYATEEWNFAYSPKYQLKRNVDLGSLDIDIEMHCEKGHIKEVQFNTDTGRIWPDLSDKLKSTLHHPSYVLDILKNEEALIQTNISIDKLASALF